tara:strand:- start:463 stop:648 length:186 start_codon:yes stop_codon:yes gene_type:complete
MMRQALLGLSPLQVGVGSGTLVTGVLVLGPDKLTFKEAIKSGAFVGVGMFAAYSIIDAVFE